MSNDYVIIKNNNHSNLNLENAEDTMPNIMMNVSVIEKIKIIDAAQNLARGGLQFINSTNRVKHARIKNILRFQIEWHSKL